MRCEGAYCASENEATEPHICPYAQEIHDDLTECNCCDYCTQECAQDI